MTITWFCVTPERTEKTSMLMRALAHGWREPCSVKVGNPPDDDSAFAVWGQEWLTLRIVPRAHAAGRPYYHLDNGYWRPGRGRFEGYYRITYRGLAPVMLRRPDLARGKRMGPMFKPWRAGGRHVLIAIPGRHFGLALGIDVDGWIATIQERVRAHTDRPVKIRPRDSGGPLEGDLRDCWALVTHSSNVATEAVWNGVPVFVAPTSPAAPVGNLDLADLERPATPDRRPWHASLMSQQFSLSEMADGTAYDLLMRLRDQVDGHTSTREATDGVHV
jgi:hypothetical protein